VVHDLLMHHIFFVAVVVSNLVIPFLSVDVDDPSLVEFSIEALDDAGSDSVAFSLSLEAVYEALSNGVLHPLSCHGLHPLSWMRLYHPL